jgi:hypothetical protein
MPVASIYQVIPSNKMQGAWISESTRNFAAAGSTRNSAIAGGGLDLARLVGGSAVAEASVSVRARVSMLRLIGK